MPSVALGWSRGRFLKTRGGRERSRNNAPRAIACSPTGLSHAICLGHGYSFFHLDRLCRKLCLGKGRIRVCARKMGYQEARFARRGSRKTLAPQRAQKQLSSGFKASAVRPEALPSALAEAQHNRSQLFIDHGAFLSERTLRREVHHRIKTCHYAFNKPS